MNCPTPSDLRSEASVARKLAALRAVPRARHQWGTASPGGLLAESHVNNSVNSGAHPQGAGVTLMRHGGAL